MYAISRTLSVPAAPARFIGLRRGSRRDGLVDQAACVVDEEAIFDPPARRCSGLRGNARNLHCRAIGDDRVAIDALKHDWTVGHDCVEIGGSREALVRPQLLVPAEADDPRVVRMRGGVIANALLQVGN